MIRNETLELVCERIRHIGTWLEDEAPYAQFDQRHLDAATPERAYWHLGYRAALCDLLDLMRNETESIQGTASYSPPAAPDA
ncbi:MAG: hypothetical protein AB7O43_04355 [Hyphomicrobiaceae bacterium]